MKLWNYRIPIVVCLVTLAVGQARGLILVGEGNEPMDDPGFPDGAMAVVNRESRVGFLEGPPFGGGEYLFRFQETGTEGFNEALAAFARVRVPQPAYRSLISLTGETTTWQGEIPLLLVVRDALPGAWGRSDEERTDWTFHIWIPRNFHALYSGDAGWLADHPNQREPVPPPRIDVCVGDDSPIRWEDVRVPDGIRIEDRRSAVTPDRGPVRGRVISMVSNAGLPGATVRLIPAGDPVAGFEVTAGADGHYLFSDILAGRYKLQIDAPGHASRVVGTFEFGQGATPLGVDGLLAPTGAVAGVVVDVDGNPLSNLVVQARDSVGLDGRGYTLPGAAETETGPGGQFVLTDLPVGSARLQVKAAGLYQVGVVRARFPVRARRFSEAEDARLVMTGTGEVRVSVPESAGKGSSRQYVAELEPEGGSKVGSWGGSANIAPGADYTFSGVPPGAYIVKVKPNPGREDEGSAPIPVRITAGSSTNIVAGMMNGGR